ERSNLVLDGPTAEVAHRVGPAAELQVRLVSPTILDWRELRIVEDVHARRAVLDARRTAGARRNGKLFEETLAQRRYARRVAKNRIHAGVMILVLDEALFVRERPLRRAGAPPLGRDDDDAVG